MEVFLLLLSSLLRGDRLLLIDDPPSASLTRSISFNHLLLAAVFTSILSVPFKHEMTCFARLYNIRVVRRCSHILLSLESSEPIRTDVPDFTSVYFSGVI